MMLSVYPLAALTLLALSGAVWAVRAATATSRPAFLAHRVS